MSKERYLNKDSFNLINLLCNSFFDYIFKNFLPSLCSLEENFEYRFLDVIILSKESKTKYIYVENNFCFFINLNDNPTFNYSFHFYNNSINSVIDLKRCSYLELTVLLEIVNNKERYLEIMGKVTNSVLEQIRKELLCLAL